MINKYIKHAEYLIKSEDPEVSSFASDVYNNAILLKSGSITNAQFDDGVYISTERPSSSINLEVLPRGQVSFFGSLDRTSINYIKKSITLYSSSNGLEVT
jgi:hypothetical protein